ncbi:MAG: hypothetical protein R3351_05910, partial [Nitrospirales bacterium]|nr:hypothetical protein [Nitrospirales bacterium]
QWFRSYYFNPLTRYLRKTKLPTWVSLAIVQLSTMVLIGLWHGATWNFVFWGLWHGIGLFIHNRWHAWLSPFMNRRGLSVGQQKVSSMMGVVLTFHFVAVGWVFFALSEPTAATHALLTLFGLTL